MGRGEEKMMEREKLIEAAKLLKEYCDSHGDCNRCPFICKTSDGFEECSISEFSPDAWDLPEEQDDE